MKITVKLLFLGFLAQFCFPFSSHDSQEREKIIITDLVNPNLTAITLQVNPLPKFTFALNKTLRIRKTDKAAMYEYGPKKPDKPYRHLMIFLELLQQETKTKLPKVDVVAVTVREFLDIVEVEVNGLVWTEPLTEASAKVKESRLLWYAEKEAFRVFVVNLKDPARVLLLEQFLTHLMLLTEWELGVRNISPEDTDVFTDKRKEEWKRQEGKAYVLFGRISGNWRLLQLDWPPTLPQRPKVFSIPLPWPPWPKNSR